MTPLYIHKTNQGFTLIELLVVMALGLAVLGAILSIFIQHNKTSAAEQEVAHAQQNARAAMDLMLRDIRNAGHDPQGNGFAAIATAEANSIRILSDSADEDGDGVAGDGDTDDISEDVTYTVNASDQLERNTLDDDGNIEVTSIVDYVEALEFGYVLADGTMLPPPSTPTADQVSEIRAVIIRLSIRTENPAPDTGEYRVRTLVNGARIRNLGFQDIS